MTLGLDKSRTSVIGSPELSTRIKNSAEISCLQRSDTGLETLDETLGVWLALNSPYLVLESADLEISVSDRLLHFVRDSFHSDLRFTSQRGAEEIGRAGVPLPASPARRGYGL